MAHSINSAIPPMPARPTSAVAMQGLRGSAVKFGALSSDSTSLVDGPTRFVDHLVNPFTTHNIQVADMELEGVSTKQTDMHEQSLRVVVKIDREDFTEKHVTMSIWQWNLFLAQMHLQALRVYEEETRRSDKKALSQVNLMRLIRSNSRLEILKFLSAKEMFKVTSVLGVQFGNRHVNAKTGPGIAVITSGSVELRNTCLNDFVADQDELWLVLRSREPGAPLAAELRSYRYKGGPRAGDRNFIDLAGRSCYGPAYKIGHVADKYHLDLPNERTRRVANGLAGTSQECHWAESGAPAMRVVLTTCGIKMHQV